MEDTEVNDNNEYLPFIEFLLFCLYELLMQFWNNFQILQAD